MRNGERVGVVGVHEMRALSGTEQCAGACQVVDVTCCEARFSGPIKPSQDHFPGWASLFWPERGSHQDEGLPHSGN
jgi:hypothetical protein